MTDRLQERQPAPAGGDLNAAVEPLNPLTPTHRRRLDDQVQRIGQILEAKPELTIGPITIGPHA